MDPLSRAALWAPAQWTHLGSVRLHVYIDRVRERLVDPLVDALQSSNANGSEFGGQRAALARTLGTWYSWIGR